YATDHTRSVCPLRVSRNLGSWAASGDSSNPRQAMPRHTITGCIRPPFVFIADPLLFWSSSLICPTPQPHFYPCPTRLSSPQPPGGGPPHRVSGQQRRPGPGHRLRGHRVRHPPGVGLLDDAGGQRQDGGRGEGGSHGSIAPRTKMTSATWWH